MTSHRECIAVGFIQLLYMASLQTLQTKIAVYDNALQRTGRDPFTSISGTLNSGLVADLLGFSVCLHVGLPLPCLLSVLHIFRSFTQ